MLKLLARYRGIIAVGILLAMPLMLLYAQTKKPEARGPVVGVFVDVAALIERAMLWSVGGILDGFEHYFTSVRSYEELARLRRDAHSAVQAEARIHELEVENEELRSLAHAVESIDGPRPIGARVVARSGAPLTRLFTLDVGTADGVRRGDGVVDKDGVVGLVLSVGRRSCDVLLLSDSSSALDVVVQRTRARGILRGDGSNERYGAKVEDFDKLRDVQPGDAIVTSGLGARFPPGVLVGTVTDADAPDDSLYLKATIRPAAELDRVEHLAVLVDRPPPRAPRLGGRDEDDLAPDAGPGGSSPPGGSSLPSSTKPGAPAVKPDAKAGAAAKPGDASTKPGDAGATKPGDAKPGDAKPGAATTTKPGDAKPGDAKPGAATTTKPGDAKPGDAKPGDAKPGAATKPGDAKPGDAKPGAATKPGATSTKPGAAKPGAAKPGDAKPGDAKPGDAKPGDAKPGAGGDGKPR